MSDTEPLRSKITRIPMVPGVYQFKSGGEIIYIGKAKLLRNRVRSYFNPDHADLKAKVIVSRADDIEWIVTDSDVEALVLENTLIKKHRPKYNIELKDNKRYPYLRITVDEPFPRIEVVRAIEKDGARYFGPYVDARSMRRVMKILEEIFQIRTCSTLLPAPAGKRPCLNHQIGKCRALCAGRVGQEEYGGWVGRAVLFLNGRGSELVSAMETEMREAASLKEFERAAQVRDGLLAIKSVLSRQRMSFSEIHDRDVAACAIEGRDCCAVVFQVREGAVAGRHHFFLKLAGGEGEGEVMGSFMQEYYRKERHIPSEIMAGSLPPEAEILEAWLSSEAGGKVRLLVPRKGEKAKLVELCRKNARLLLNDLLVQRAKQEGEVPASLQFLKKELMLTRVPRRIEAFDISHTSGVETVASQVTFVNGLPYKSGYRKYIIRTVAGVDDFASMKEVIGRRVRRAKEEDDPLPDLLLIDGGKGQLSAALEVLDAAGERERPVAALAKRFEEIFVRGHAEPLMISRRSPALRLLQRIRDEAHRFAVTFHRKRREKRAFQ